MKQSLYIFLCLLFTALSLSAQNERKNIVQDLNTPKLGQGTVRILQDEAIQHLIANRPDSVPVFNWNTGNDMPASGTTNFIKVRGYKIQVFSGNNQTKSKQEAESKRAQVVAAFPELEAVVSFHSPFWRLRVGNFQSREEAQEILNDMKRTFPSFREMYIVSDIIKRPAY